MQFDDAGAATLHDVLAWRRDVRHFRRDPIPEPVMTRLAMMMDHAPSVGNARPWRVVRVQSPDLRAAVIRIFEASNTQAAQIYDDDARAEYLALKLAGLRDAPEHLAVFTDTAPDAGRGLGRQTMPETLHYSTTMAIHTLWLAARAENIGLGWVSIIDPAAICAVFNAPPQWELTGYLCLGHPQTHDDTPLLHRAGWQKNISPAWETR